MTLTTSPGASDADAYVSLASFQAFMDARGYAYSGVYDDAAQEAAIRRATTYLSMSFVWQGYRTYQRNQAQAWPRSGVVDYEGLEVPYDTIPSEITQATCEAAWYELSTGSLSPAVVLADRIKSESVGPLSVTYADSAGEGASRPILPLLRDIVKGLLATGTMNGMLVRA